MTRYIFISFIGQFKDGAMWNIICFYKDTAESIQWFIEDEVFSCSLNWLLAHPLPLSLQSASCLSFPVSLCVTGRATVVHSSFLSCTVFGAHISVTMNGVWCTALCYHAQYAVMHRSLLCGGSGFIGLLTVWHNSHDGSISLDRACRQPSFRLVPTFH